MVLIQYFLFINLNHKTQPCLTVDMYYRFEFLLTFLFPSKLESFPICTEIQFRYWLN
jgi:hypothetical protein